MPMIDTTPTDDAELLRRYADARDEGAFAELVRRYLGLVYHTARRQMSGDGHAAEDVAQRVFTLLARKAPSLRHHAALAGWLHTTTRFAASETLRVERRRSAREQEAFIMHGNNTVGPGPENDAAWEDLRPVIDEALSELDAPDREAVLLRYFADLPHAQLGARFSISENAARMRVERALEKLHTRLARRGVTSTASALGVVLASQVGAASAALPAGMATSVTSAALAGSVATGLAASMAGVFGFMSTAKIVMSVAMVLGVAGLGSALYERNRANQTEAVLAALRHETEELRAQAARQEARAREVDGQARASVARVAALQKEIANVRAAPHPLADATKAPTPALARYSSVNPMLKDQEYLRLMIQKYRAELGQRFALLYKTLNLSQEQIAKFESNRAESHQVLQELLSSADLHGMSPNEASFAKLSKEAGAPYEAELKTLLGDDGYGLHAMHNRSQAAFGFVREYAGAVYPSDAPLTAAQGELLAQVVIKETRTVPVIPGSAAISYVVDWDTVAKQAQTILSTPQVAALQALIDSRKLQDRMVDRMREMQKVTVPKPGN